MKKFHGGDKGETVFGGEKVSKDSLIIECIGELDELNSFIGVIREDLEYKDIDELLEKIQNHLFEIGAFLHNKKNLDLEEMVKFIENSIEKFEKEISEINRFVLPIGKIHYCRAICRRVERRFVSLKAEKIIKYLNRLSDLFFVLGRVYLKRKGIAEKYW